LTATSPQGGGRPVSHRHAADEVDVSRGDVICAAASPVEVADQFEAQILWMSDEPMLAGRPYILKLATQVVAGSLAAPKYKVNVNTLEHTAAKTLELNEIGVCNVRFDRPVAFTPYAENRDLGGFIIIDRFSNNTVGMGLINFALMRASNVHWQALEVSKSAHAALKGQKPCILWFTGLSGSGKSTIANLVEKRLHAMGKHTYLLDGDNVRHGLNQDLGFTDADRVENIRRVAEVAKLMVDAGLIVLVSFISPFRSERRMARELVRRASSSRCSSTRRSRSANSAIPRASMPRHGAARSRTLPASTAITSARNWPKSCSTPPKPRPTPEPTVKRRSPLEMAMVPSSTKNSASGRLPSRVSVATPPAVTHLATFIRRRNWPGESAENTETRRCSSGVSALWRRSMYRRTIT
jgi:hypothetical protein